MSKKMTVLNPWKSPAYFHSSEEWSLRTTALGEVNCTVHTECVKPTPTKALEVALCLPP